MSNSTIARQSSAVIVAPSCPKQRGYMMTMLQKWGEDRSKLPEKPIDLAAEKRAMRLDCRIAIFRTALKHRQCFSDEVMLVEDFEAPIVRNAFGALTKLMSNWERGFSIPVEPESTSETAAAD